jgi:hypothetical protein
MPGKTGTQISKPAGKPNKEKFRLESAKLILKTFSIEVIRQRSIDNMDRWKSQGSWSLAFDEWMILMTDGTDADVIEAMTGETDKASRLRSASPYPGLLDQTVVHQLKHEILGIDLAVFDNPRTLEMLQKDAEFEAARRKSDKTKQHE